MIGLEDRQVLARNIEVAHQAGARLRLACATAGIDLRTMQRWQAYGKAHSKAGAPSADSPGSPGSPGSPVNLSGAKGADGATGVAASGEAAQSCIKGDGRPGAVRPVPAHALTAAERAAVLSAANQPRFADLPPARIVPMLADEGLYLASESTFSRLLAEQGQDAHRGRAKAPSAGRPPSTHIATGPRQVWCWDMTYLPTLVAGQWFYLYLILDLYSRKIVGWEVHARDHADHAAHLVKRTALAEGIAALAAKPVLHGDNGATLKATTVLAMLHWLGVRPSYSRPRVSDDNAYAEALFRTAKYRPEFPVEGFADLEQARIWAASFVHWYNVEHRHSGIRYVSPEQRHAGDDVALLAARHALYLAARERHPARWSRSTRNWSHIGAVTLNPERDAVVNMAQPSAANPQRLAA